MTHIFLKHSCRQFLCTLVFALTLSNYGLSAGIASFRTTLNDTGRSFEHHGYMSSHLIETLSRCDEKSQNILFAGNGLSEFPIEIAKISSVQAMLINDLDKNHLISVREMMGRVKRDNLIAFDTGDFSQVLRRLEEKAALPARSWLGNGHEKFDVIYIANMFHFLSPQQFMDAIEASYFLLKPGGLLYTMHRQMPKIGSKRQKSLMGTSQKLGGQYDASFLEDKNTQLASLLRDRGQKFYGFFPAGVTLLHGKNFKFHYQMFPNKTVIDIMTSSGLTKVDEVSLSMSPVDPTHVEIYYPKGQAVDSQMIFQKNQLRMDSEWDQLRQIAEEETARRPQLIEEIRKREAS